VHFVVQDRVQRHLTHRAWIHEQGIVFHPLQHFRGFGQAGISETRGPGLLRLVNPGIDGSLSAGYTGYGWCLSMVS
jgi:hypothetical protein